VNQLVVKDLTVEFNSGGYAVKPFDNYNLTINAGELVILLGPSGCGKTTLLSCLAGILTPTSGSILVDDLDVTKLGPKEMTGYRRETVGIVFQGFKLISSLTARENVEASLRLAGVPVKPARARAEELLTRFGLAERMHHRPGKMSGGQQQRVAIARALAHDPPVVLADEPTAQLDYIQVEGVIRTLRELAGPGRVVIVSTHDQRLVPLADRVVELEAGKTIDLREPDRVTLPAGAELFAQGTRGELVYVVEDGAVDLVRQRADGTEELLHVARPGEYFGELAPLLGFPRAATARGAAGGANVTGYTVAEFRKLVGPEGMRRALSMTGERPQLNKPDEVTLPDEETAVS
jgi:putative ABC transport system ATP-binding protein